MDFGGIYWNIFGVGNAFNNGNDLNEVKNFKVNCKGYNYNELNIWADKLKKTLEINPRIQNIQIKENSSYSKPPSFEYHFFLNKDQLALNKVSPNKIIEELSETTLSKGHDLFINLEGKYTPIRFESEDFK